MLSTEPQFNAKSVRVLINNEIKRRKQEKIQQAICKDKVKLEKNNHYCVKGCKHK